MNSKNLKFLFAAAVLLNLTACSSLTNYFIKATESSVEFLQSNVENQIEIPSVMPNPDSLSTTFNSHLRIYIQSDNSNLNDSLQEFDAKINTNRKAVQILVMANDEKIWNIDFDGIIITEERGEHLSDKLEALQLLRDIALIYWPTASVKKQLKDWKFIETDTARQFYLPGKSDPAITVEYRNEILFENHLQGYRLVVETTVPYHLIN